MSGQVFEACMMKAQTDSFPGWVRGSSLRLFYFDRSANGADQRGSERVAPTEASLLLNSSAWSAGLGRLVDERKLKKGQRWAP